MLALLVLLLLAPPAGAAWSWPADGPVAGGFTYDTRAPFERGARRGIVIGAARGSPVRAACDGRVRFAGTTGANGRTVTIACGPYATTYLALSSIGVREGARVGAGDRLGRAGPDGLRFGVRRSGDRWGYLDPLAFLPSRRGPGDGPALGRSPRSGPLRGAPPALAPTRPPPALAPARPPPAQEPVVGGERKPPTAPLVAWAGLAAVACGVVGTPLIRLGRRRRRDGAAAATLRPTWTRR